MTSFAQRYGPWAVVAGGSDGTGAAFAEELCARGVGVVLVARRRALLDELAARLDGDTRVVRLDLARDGAAEQLAAATRDVEVGTFVYNAGADSYNTLFLDTPIESWLSMVRRNCSTMLAACHHYGGEMVERGRGGMVLVTSGAAWAGGGHVAAYGATKAFDLLLAEGLWAEWHERGVDVLSLVLGATDTPSLRRSLERGGGSFGALADPAGVARTALDHLAEGPTWIFGAQDPTGPSPLGALPRRRAVELMTGASAAMFGDEEDS